MPAKVIFTSNTHPVRSFMGAKSNTVPRVAREKKKPYPASTTRMLFEHRYGLKLTTIECAVIDERLQHGP